MSRTRGDRCGWPALACGMLMLALCFWPTIARAQLPVTKVAVPSTVIEGRAVSFTIVIENGAPFELVDLELNDVFPDCLDTTGFRTSLVTVDPGPAVVSYLAATRTLTVEIPSLPGFSSQTVRIEGLAAARGGTSPCCNQGVFTTEIGDIPSDDPSTPMPSDPTCFTIIPDTGLPDFRTSVKAVSTRLAGHGDEITYTLTITNSSVWSAVGRTFVEDVWPACIDASSPTGFTIDPGPGDAMLGAASLLVSFEDFAAGATQTITVEGLKAQLTGPPGDDSCCNSATVSDDSGTILGVTDDAPGGLPLGEPTCFTLNEPEFEAYKEVSPISLVSPGAPVTYSLTLTNVGGSAESMSVTDVLPDCLDDADFDEAMVSVTPGPVAMTFYDRPSRTLLLGFEDFPGVPAAGSEQTITISGLTTGAATSMCCNQGEVLVDLTGQRWLTDVPPGGGSDPLPTCVEIATAADFTGSLKDVDPRSGIRPDDPIEYTLTVSNSGALDSGPTDIVDVLPSCLDDSAFDPATDVSVSPGPATAISYDDITRTLTVSIASFPVTGGDQVITISGLTARFATASCCNQAEIVDAASGMSLALSDDAPGGGSPGDETCVAVASDDDNKLLRNAEWPATATIDIFTGPTSGCAAPLDPAITLDPFGADCAVTAFPGADDDDTHVIGFSSGSPDPEPGVVSMDESLFFYQLDNAPSVGNNLRVVKTPDAGDPTGFVYLISF